jgi:hypothetical protein
MFDLDQNQQENNEENVNTSTPDLNTDNKSDLIDFRNINNNFQPQKTIPKKLSDNLVNPSPAQNNLSFDPDGFLAHVKSSSGKTPKANDLIELKNVNSKNEVIKLNELPKDDDHWSVQSSDQDTIQDNNIRNDDVELKNLIHAASASVKNENSDSHYKLLTSSEKSSEERKISANKLDEDDEIVLKPSKRKVDKEKDKDNKDFKNNDVVLNIENRK